MNESQTEFLTTECPNGHRVRGDIGWLNRQVNCPHCHAEFVFRRPESQPKEVLVVQARASDANQPRKDWSPTDTGVMRILGDYLPPANEGAQRQCQQCGATFPAWVSRCEHCNLELAAANSVSADTATAEEPAGSVDFREVDKVAFDDVTVRRVIRPRREIIFLDVNDSLEQMRKQVRQTMHSRYPVCDGSLDRILGVVHIKDILVADQIDFDICSLLTSPAEILDTTPVSKVLQSFQAENVPMTFVVDEFENIIGMVTLKDVLSKLVDHV